MATIVILFIVSEVVTTLAGIELADRRANL